MAVNYYAPIGNGDYWRNITDEEDTTLGKVAIIGGKRKLVVGDKIGELCLVDGARRYWVNTSCSWAMDHKAIMFGRFALTLDRIDGGRFYYYKPLVSYRPDDCSFSFFDSGAIISQSLVYDKLLNTMNGSIRSVDTLPNIYIWKYSQTVSNVSLDSADYSQAGYASIYSNGETCTLHYKKQVQCVCSDLVVCYGGSLGCSSVVEICFNV